MNREGEHQTSKPTFRLEHESNHLANDDEECSRSACGWYLSRMSRSARKRKFIVYIATSADGFIARSDGSVDWLESSTSKR